MNRKEAVIAALFIAAAWWVYDIYRDNKQLKVNNTTLSGQLSAQQVILDTHLKLTAVMNGISQDNVSQREQTAKDAEEVKTVIKTVFVGNDCADAYVPSGYTDELRRFRNGEVHTGSGAANASATDR